ncbi:UNVERIFIED_CONTAM: hypothetical protein FKN15_028204 [Acipenser sinensis]
MHASLCVFVRVHCGRKLSEVDMDKVTAAMVLTSLSTSPLVRSPPVKVNDGTNESWKEVGFNPSSYSSSGYWSWSAPSDQSNPSTPSPPLSTDSCKPFHIPSQPDDGIDEVDASDLLFNEPVPRKRKNSMKVMFKCLWKNCGKVLSTATGIQKHICTVHLGRSCDSDCSDGEEDFYYTEIKLNTDSVADGLSSLSPVSPSMVSPPHIFSSTEPGRPESVCMKNESKLTTPLSRSAPSTLYLVHADHAYQVKATAPVNIPGSAKFTPSSSSFSISWQSPPVAFTGIPASPPHIRTHGFGEYRPQAHVVLSSPPRAAVGLRSTPQQLEELRQVNLLNRQAVGRNLSAVVAARCQLWLSQAHIVDGDKGPLLDTPITSGHAFGPAVDDMLQHSHRVRKSTKELVRLLPKRLPPVRRPAPNWRPGFEQSRRHRHTRLLLKPEGVFTTDQRQCKGQNFNKFSRQAQRQKPPAKQQL